MATDFGAAADAAAQAAEADVATAGESAAPSAVEILTGWERRRSEAREKQNASKEQEKKPEEMPDVPEDEAQAQEAEEGTDGPREGKTSGTAEAFQGAADTGSAGEDSVNATAGASAAASEKNAAAGNTVNIFINGQPVRLTGKKSYIFVDIFDFYEFDLKASAGRAVVTKRNGENAQFTAELCEGDQIELGWQEN